MVRMLIATKGQQSATFGRNFGGIVVDVVRRANEAQATPTCVHSSLK